MPSLVRLIVIVGLLFAAGYGGLYVLSEFFEPEQREVTRPVPGVKIKKQ